METKKKNIWISISQEFSKFGENTHLDTWSSVNQNENEFKENQSQIVKTKDEEGIFKEAREHRCLQRRKIHVWMMASVP